MLGGKIFQSRVPLVLLNYVVLLPQFRRNFHSDEHSRDLTRSGCRLRISEEKDS